MASPELRAIRALHDTLEYLCVKIQSLEQKVDQMSGTTDTVAAEITNLTSAVAQETSVNQSAVTMISGFAAQLAAAVAAAQAAGASTDQLAALNSLSSTITSNASSLAAAVTANTPQAPAPAPTPGS